MTRPRPVGWCPGAYRPMMSGDGLIVRVRPRLARLTAGQALGLCEASLGHGNGIIDLTNRANLQIRGIPPARHEALLTDLVRLDLLDSDPALESRRNILVAPDWEEGDDTCRIAEGLMKNLSELPELPAKFGFAIDAGPCPVLGACSADIRIERAATGGLILRAEGACAGVDVDVGNAVDRALELARWFAKTRSRGTRRMARHLAKHFLPRWAVGTTRPAPAGDAIGPGRKGGVWALGVPFGQIGAAAMSDMIRESGATAVRLTPWRVFLLEDASQIAVRGFVTRPDDPLLGVDACPGAPLCDSASVGTRSLARQLAPLVSGRLHVSGCAKGCARPRRSDVVLTGREGLFDLVLNGHSWDAPRETGLTPQAVLVRFGAG